MTRQKKKFATLPENKTTLPVSDSKSFMAFDLMFKCLEMLREQDRATMSTGKRNSHFAWYSQKMSPFLILKIPMLFVQPLHDFCD